MSVYVDEPRDYGDAVRGQAGRWGTRWSHMMADTEEELISMARKLGLHESYIQHRGTHRAHFDVTPLKRELAIKLGAIPKSIREMMRERASSR